MKLLLGCRYIRVKVDKIKEVFKKRGHIKLKIEWEFVFNSYIHKK